MNPISVVDHFFEHFPSSQACLPDRFLNPDTADEAWTHAFGFEKRLKKMADGIRKCSLVRSLPGSAKKIVRLPESQILATFYGSEAIRGMFEHSVRSSNKNAITLSGSVPWLLGVLLSASPYDSSIDCSKSVLLSGIDPEFIEQFSRFFSAMSDEAYYSDLKPRHRDIADLCLNVILSSNDPDDALLFFNQHPWLKESQTNYLDRISDLDEEDEDESPVDRYAEQMLFMIHDLHEQARKYRDQQSIRCFMEIRSGIRSLERHHLEHGAESFSSAVQEDHQQMVALFTHAGDVFNRFKMADAIAIWNPVHSAIKSLPPFEAVDPSCDEQIGVLEAYQGNRRQLANPVRQSFQDLHSGIHQLEYCMGELSRITQSQDGGLDEIIKLNQELIESKLLSLAKASELAPIGVKLIEQISEFTLEIKRLKAIPKIDHAKLAGELTEQVNRFQLENHELEIEVSRLSDANSELEQSLAKERERRENQEEQAAIARREAHELKNAMAHFGKAPSMDVAQPSALETPFIVELMKGTAKLTPQIILESFAALYPQDFILLDSAIKSAKDASNFELGGRLVAVMQSLHEYLLLIRAGKPDSEARMILGGNYASHESTTVVSNTKLRAQREFEYGGETVLFLSNVGVGRGRYGTQHQIRVYFKIIQDKLVIAYCGERLDSATSN